MVKAGLRRLLLGAVALCAPLGLAGASVIPVSATAQAAAAPAPFFRAEIRTPTAIWARQSNIARPLSPSAWKLTDFAGAEVPIARVLPGTTTTTLIVPARPLALNQTYFLELREAGLKARVRPDGWFRNLYSDKPLGAEVAPDGSRTDVRIFSPRATMVKLYLYDRHDATPAQARQVIEMVRDADGVWEANLPGDRHGTYYDFTVHGPTGAGTFFYETHPVHISDPYARVQAESQGKSRIWRPTRPATGVRGGRPKMEDVVAYEVHIQDFTDRLPVADPLKGTLPALHQAGLRNRHGQPVGIDHIARMGVNVVHLLPMQEYLHYPEDEWQAAFANNEYMQRMGVANLSYEWGYRTTHAFAIENRYRAGGTDYGAERDQFRDLVQAFHDRGIAVIVDIVPNHTGENMDARNMLFNWNVLDRDYHYRTDENGNHIGVFGNEVKTEERPMNQRWLIDQVKHMMDEFGIDGVRIDLAGQMDEQTLIKFRQSLPPDTIIYGEPWIDVQDPEVRANPDWDWYKEDAPITFFQDDTRNAFVGSPFRLIDKPTDRGFAGGNGDLRDETMRGLANDWPEERGDTRRGLTYTDIHDNWTLADRFATRDWNGLLGVDEGNYRIAAGLKLTSLGPVVLHGGSEMMRSKGIAPIEEFVLQTASGPIYMKGRHDTYNVRTPNHFIWDDLGTTRRNNTRDVDAMVHWWEGLIKFRMSSAGAVFRVPAIPSPDHYRWITPANTNMLGYVVGGSVFVATNSGTTAGVFEDVVLPPGQWKLVADGSDTTSRIDIDRGLRARDGTLVSGPGDTFDIPVSAAGFRMWVRQP